MVALNIWIKGKKELTLSEFINGVTTLVQQRLVEL